MLVVGIALRKYARAEGSELVETFVGIFGLTLVAGGPVRYRYMVIALSRAAVHNPFTIAVGARMRLVAG
jgi:hypothetical protein